MRRSAQYKLYCYKFSSKTAAFQPTIDSDFIKHEESKYLHRQHSPEAALSGEPTRASAESQLLLVVLPSSPWVMRGTMKMTPILDDSGAVLLLQDTVTDDDKQTPVLGRCSSSSSLSEVQDGQSDYVMTLSNDDSSTATYTLTRRRSRTTEFEKDEPPETPDSPSIRSRMRNSISGIAPDSPSLRRRMRNSFNQSRRRINKMQRRFGREGKKSKWLIAADHPCKVAWDALTILLSFLGAFTTHASIRDRAFGRSYFNFFCEVWFLVDILLNFVTEHKTSEGHVIRDGKAVWARYLTTWFAVDALSLVPWESLYVKPIIEMQNRRNILKKTFFRSRAVIRVTRVLRGRHFRLFGKVASHTRHAGVNGKRLLRLLIKYLPKYLLFYRNMKGVLVVRTLRQVHWIRKVTRNFFTQKVVEDVVVDDVQEEEDDDDFVHVFEYAPLQ